MSGRCRRGAKQAQRPTDPGLSIGYWRHPGIDASVRPGYRSVDWQGLEGRLDALQGVLAPGALRSVRGGVRSGRELRERDHRDCKLGGQIGCIDLSETDDD
jgi:hypothetical protein